MDWDGQMQKRLSQIMTECVQWGSHLLCQQPPAYTVPHLVKRGIYTWRCIQVRGWPCWSLPQFTLTQSTRGPITEQLGEWVKGSISFQMLGHHSQGLTQNMGMAPRCEHRAPGHRQTYIHLPVVSKSHGDRAVRGKLRKNAPQECNNEKRWRNTGLKV